MYSSRVENTEKRYKSGLYRAVNANTLEHASKDGFELVEVVPGQHPVFLVRAERDKQSALEQAKAENERLTKALERLHFEHRERDTEQLEALEAAARRVHDADMESDALLEGIDAAQGQADQLREQVAKLEAVLNLYRSEVGRARQAELESEGPAKVEDAIAPLRLRSSTTALAALVKAAREAQCADSSIRIPGRRYVTLEDWLMGREPYLRGLLGW